MYEVDVGGVSSDDPFPDPRQQSKLRTMEGDCWTLVQKKTSQKLQTEYISRMDAVGTSVTQKGDSKLQKYESSASGSLESQGTVLDASAHVTSAEQTDVNSLIGMPFIIRSYQDVESKAEESLNDAMPRRLKSDNLGKSGSVRGLLRIDPNKLNRETVVASNGKEVRDMSEMNEVDWPSISGYHTMKDDHSENVSSVEDSKSWSTVLRTISLPRPIKRVSMTTAEYKSYWCQFQALLVRKREGSSTHWLCACTWCQYNNNIIAKIWQSGYLYKPMHTYSRLSLEYNVNEHV